MPGMNLIPVSTCDYRRLAEKHLPRNLFDYIDGGSYSEITLQANVQDFEKIQMKQSVLCDVSNIDTNVNLLGEKFSMPLGLAPVGLAGMMARRAEVQAVKAAEKAGIPFWFQLYMMRDRSYVEELLARAKAVGCKTLVFTVDLTVVGARYRDARNGMGARLNAFAKVRAAMEYPTHPKWLLDVAIKGKPHMFGNLEKLVPSAGSLADFKDWVDSQFDPSCTWKDIEWLRSIWDGDLIIKGILSPEDAKAAVRAGADAIIISNHGGRQMDGVSSSITMTPRIRDAVGDKTTIIMDGGIRSGQDVVKALANGADFTLIGRAWIWALAARGQEGLDALLQTFKSEMDVNMALAGVTIIADITNEILDKG
jgi:L-lactate dehydrogenase (cytochrome)